MKTQENNKLIAEFMNLETRDGCYFEYITKEGERSKPTHFILLKYHLSWSWLIPVVNKIRSFDCEFDIEHIGVFEVDGENWIGKSISHYEFDLDLTYNAVVEFIKYKQ